MRSVEHLGYIVRQADNHHVTIYENGAMVMHAQCEKRLSDKELRAMVHHYLYLVGKVWEEEGAPNG